MNTGTRRAGLDRCTSCGVALGESGNKGLCPARLISEVTCTEYETVPIVHEYQTRSIGTEHSGPTTLGIQVATNSGRAPQSRELVRGAIMWLSMVAPAAILATRAIANPSRILNDRISGVWVGRR